MIANFKNFLSTDPYMKHFFAICLCGFVESSFACMLFWLLTHASAAVSQEHAYMLAFPAALAASFIFCVLLILIRLIVKALKN